MPYKTFTTRLGQVAEELKERNLPALIVFGWGAAHGQTTFSHGNIRYLTGWDSQRFSSLLLIFPDEERPVLLVPNIGAYDTAREQLGFCDVRFSAPDRLGEMAIACLDARKIARDASIAMLGRAEMPVSVWENLGLSLEQIVDLQDVMNARRVIKDSVALTLHRRAATTCDAIFAALPSQLHSGENLFVIRARLQALAAQYGAEYCDMWLTAAPNAPREYMFKVDMQRVPQPGDQILFGVSLMIDGHWGHGVRTGHMGLPGPRHQFFYDAMRSIYDLACSELKPGKDLAVLNQDMMDALARQIPDYADSNQFSRFRYAHGLGLSYEDPIVTASFPQPYIAGDTPRSLIAEPGMLLEIHPNIFHASEGGCAIGNMLLVTENGCQALTTHDLSLARY